ncbi:MAG: hypothetical protein LBH93_06725 [Chitinispirillales bacterium]|nr:hypothetical protein [Chitinispirillales bacterium]
MRARKIRLPAPLQFALPAAAAFFLIIFLMIFGCSGGFGADGEGAAELGPGIFGPDSAK